MANQMTPEQREQAAQDRIRSFLSDLYGEEPMLIVRNTTNGVVSIGFGKLGDEGGKAIERSKLPIVLTDEFPREMWINAPDFRRAVAKGWLVPVSKDDFDGEVQKHRDRLAQLARLAEKDARPARAAAPNPFSDDPTGEAQVIDEETSQLKPASDDQRARQFLEYENGQESAPRPPDNTPAGVSVIGGQISSRAISFCEDQKRGSLTSNQAIEWLDAEEKVLTDDDLTHVIANSAFDSVKSVARRFLADRQEA